MRCGKVKCNGSTKAGGREPTLSFSAARRVQSSLDADSPSVTGAGAPYSIENGPTEVVEVTSTLIWHNAVTPK